jgi:two-component system response regulator AlgR
VSEVLKVLIVDDEGPARSRMRDLLADIAQEQPTELIGLAGNGVEALRLLETSPADLVLADVRMPVMDGVELARHVARLPSPPAVIFTTAYDQYAVEAFELAAVDYLLKPVRASRLAEALRKLRRAQPADPGVLAGLSTGKRKHFSVVERGRILLVPVADVRYLRAELKYVTAGTSEQEHLLDESLVQLEEEFGERFLRVHRNCLVALDAVAGVERDGEGQWVILLKDSHTRLPVSRRQWPAVKQALQL